MAFYAKSSFLEIETNESFFFLRTMKTARQRFFAFVIIQKLNANQPKKSWKHLSLVKENPHAKSKLVMSTCNKDLKNPSVVFVLSISFNVFCFSLL